MKEEEKDSQESREETKRLMRLVRLFFLGLFFSGVSQGFQPEVV